MLVLAGCATAGRNMLADGPASTIVIENATMVGVTFYATRTGWADLYLGTMGAQLTRRYRVPVGWGDFYIEARRGGVVLWRSLAMPRDDALVRVRYAGPGPLSTISYR